MHSGPPPGPAPLLAEAAAVIGAYAALAFFLLHPLFAHPASAVYDPIAAEGGGGLLTLPDVFLIMWVLSWGWHALTTAPRSLFDANIFHPAPDALASSEHMLGHLPIFGPVYALSENPILANQINLLLCFALCGASMYALLRHWQLPRTAAFFGGFVYAFCPVRAFDVGHAHLLAGQYLPLALLFLDRTLVRQRFADAAAFGAFVLLQMLCSFYLAYMTAAVLIGYGGGILWTTRGRVETRGLLLACGAVAAAGVVLFWLSLPYLRLRSAGTIASHTESMWLSMSGSEPWRNFVYPPALLRLGLLHLPRGQTLYLGAVAGLCAAAALLPGGGGTGTGVRWQRSAALGACIAGYLMALGPALAVAGTAVDLPYAWASRIVPGFSSMRAASRFGLAMMVGFAPLAALGWARVTRRLGQRRWQAVALLSGALGLTAFEYDLFGRDFSTRTVHPDDRVPGVYRAIEALPPGPVLEVPAGALEGELAGLAAEGRYVFNSTYHWRPLLNGYSAYRPPSYAAVMTLARSLPSSRALEVLARTTGLRYIVVHMFALSPEERRTWSDPPGLRRLGVYGLDLLFELENAPPADLREELTRPGRNSATVLGTALAPVDPENRRAELSLLRPAPATVVSGVAFPVGVTVKNISSATWPSLAAGTPEHLVVLGYRWIDAQGGVPSQVADAARLPYDLGAGESAPAQLIVTPPGAPGDYFLEIYVVQGDAWFLHPLPRLPIAVRTLSQIRGA